MLPTAMSIEIPFSSEVITSKISSVILRTVIEFLAFNRKQIPFAYDNFRYMTAKIQRQMSNKTSEEDLTTMGIERQQRKAIDTFSNLKTMLENVTEQFQNADIPQALVLFGATPLTPKEAFLITLPSVTRYHHSSNHEAAIQTVAKSIIMSILTSKKLYEIESKLNTTNMFVLLNTPSKQYISDNTFQLNEHFRLPRSCKTVELNIRNTCTQMQTNCCSHLIIFDDVINDYEQLKMSEEQELNFMEVMEEAKHKDNEDDIKISDLMWFQSTVFVRGFKDELVKGKSIWN